MSAERYIAERLVHNRMKNRLRESQKSVPDSYYKKVAYILHHRLGRYESYVNVGDIDVISETPGNITLKVTYSVDVQIPMYDPEDRRTYYETDTEYRTQTMTFDFDELDESVDNNSMECVIPVCFGYEVWQQGDKYFILNGEGDTVYTTNSTFNAKKWCKEHKTSNKWRADSKWDWSRSDESKSSARLYPPVNEDLSIDDDPEEPVKLKYISDTWNMIDKYGIEDWEDHDSYISVSKDSYEKMLNGSNNKRYIMNLRLKEDLTHPANGPRIGSKVRILRGGYRGQIGKVVDIDFDEEEGDQYSVETPDKSIRYLDDTDIELIKEDLTIDDDPEETDQQYSSAATSINSSKLPALFSM